MLDVDELVGLAFPDIPVEHTKGIAYEHILESILQGDAPEFMTKMKISKPPTKRDAICLLQLPFLYVSVDLIAAFVPLFGVAVTVVSSEVRKSLLRADKPRILYDTPASLPQTIAYSRLEAKTENFRYNNSELLSRLLGLPDMKHKYQCLDIERTSYQID